jgi:hypothetical protein
MFRRLFLTLVLVCLASSAFAHQRYWGYAYQGGGKGHSNTGDVTITPQVGNRIQQSFPNCTITVYQTGTLTLSTIYTTAAATIAKANPLTADNSGFFYFYGPEGSVYDLKFSGVGISVPFTWIGWPMGGGTMIGPGSDVQRSVPVWKYWDGITLDASPAQLHPKEARGLGQNVYSEDGGARFVYDATIQAGSHTLTSYEANFTSTEDAGAAIIVYGAGAAGASLTTTIASVTNVYTAVLTDAATTTVANSVGRMVGATGYVGDTITFLPIDSNYYHPRIIATDAGKSTARLYTPSAAPEPFMSILMNDVTYNASKKQYQGMYKTGIYMESTVSDAGGWESGLEIWHKALSSANGNAASSAITAVELGASDAIGVQKRGFNTYTGAAMEVMPSGNNIGMWMHGMLRDGVVTVNTAPTVAGTGYAVGDMIDLNATLPISSVAVNDFVATISTTTSQHYIQDGDYIVVGPASGSVGSGFAGTWIQAHSTSPNTLQYSVSPRVLIGASNTSPIILDVHTLLTGGADYQTHPYKTGDIVKVSGVAGNTAANTAIPNAVTVSDTRYITLDGTTGNGAFATFAVSTVSNLSPIEVTTTAGHSFSTGDLVFINGVAGNSAANGFRYITKTAANKFTLYNDSTMAQPVAGNGAYSSGGFIYGTVIIYSTTNALTVRPMGENARVKVTKIGVGGAIDTVDSVPILGGLYYKTNRSYYTTIYDENAYSGGTRKTGSGAVLKVTDTEGDNSALLSLGMSNGVNSEGIRIYPAGNDSQYILDAHTTAASTTLTSLSANFSANHVGAEIVISDAGATLSQGDLHTTIASVTSPTVAVLADAATSTQYGKSAFIYFNQATKRPFQINIKPGNNRLQYSTSDINEGITALPLMESYS